jgi:hypothetical protein
MTELGRSLVLAGVLLAALGAILVLAGRIPWLGRLPGDFVFRQGGVRIHLPLASCLLVSVVLSLLWSLFRR